MLPSNGTGFISSFPIWIIFITFLTVVERICKVLFNSVDESGQPCLVTDLRRKIFSLLPLSINK